MYDSMGRRRDKPGLADLFGIESVGEVAAPNGNGFYARIERRHEILEGFGDTALIPGGGFRLPVRAAGDPISSPASPPTPRTPPSFPMPRMPRRTARPSSCARRGCRAWLISRATLSARPGARATRISPRLIQNTLTWLTRGRQPRHRGRGRDRGVLRLGDRPRLRGPTCSTTRTPTCTGAGSGNSTRSGSRRCGWSCPRAARSPGWSSCARSATSGSPRRKHGGVHDPRGRRLRGGRALRLEGSRRRDLRILPRGPTS